MAAQAKRPENTQTAKRHIAKLLDQLEDEGVDTEPIRRPIIYFMHHLAMDIEARYITEQSSESICNSTQEG